MNISMSAIFESADAADLALKRVKERGISVTSSSLQPATDRKQAARQLETTPIYLPGMDGWSGGNISPLGLLRGWRTAPQSGEQPGDYRLQLELNQRDAAMAKSVLVSGHGRQVR